MGTRNYSDEFKRDAVHQITLRTRRQTAFLTITGKKFRCGTDRADSRPRDFAQVTSCTQ